jgi:hypothetical protein
LSNWSKYQRELLGPSLVHGHRFDFAIVHQEIKRLYQKEIKRPYLTRIPDARLLSAGVYASSRIIARLERWSWEQCLPLERCWSWNAKRNRGCGLATDIAMPFDGLVQVESLEFAQQPTTCHNKRWQPASSKYSWIEALSDGS